MSTTSTVTSGKRAFKLGLAVAAAVLTIAAFSACGGEPQSAEAAYAAAARKAVTKAKTLKQKADTAVAAGDKAAIKDVADELEVQYVFLQELEPPPALVEFHTTVVQQVFVVQDAAEQIVVQDLPPEEAQTVWAEVSIQWDIWVVEVWEPWEEAVAEIGGPSPTTVEDDEDAEVGDFDGDYEGAATINVTVEGTVVGPVPVPITFSVEDGEILLSPETGELLTGVSLDSSGSGELTIDLSPFGFAGTVTTRVQFSRSGDAVSVEGTISGSVSAEGVVASVDGTFTADRLPA